MKKCELTVFASYHLKTCLLWFVERFGLKKFHQWSVENIMHNLLKFFIKLYGENFLPNYFVRNNNMLDHKKQSEIQQGASVLMTMEKNISRLILYYIDTYFKLPVEFDENLYRIFQ